MRERPGRSAGRHGRDERDDAPAARGQLSLSTVEAVVGVAFVLATAATFGMALPDPGTAEAQLDAYADDAATVLVEEPPRHAGGTRLSELARSSAAFDRERDALRRRVGRILGDNLLFRVETPHGAVGYTRPPDAPLGRASVPTRGGEVVLWVWYA
ncbi:DUF7262 family protein [Candidatus Halobonum tyrrellensis]|uniref:Uncharacterized protein n=1 Tax=Candidatus Halobonum tyrrellensis G22 TaxID=1324957 RepID=V4IY68_9EURY|nr:hypothetical protein [Candidatus Halobonum tyrrellensis]ESP88102.1 hypothetical protein K933_10442 [Candidatus Halobonum tyrrellensis G22]